jgi:DNA-binding MarR family transcriptional regulator
LTAPRLSALSVVVFNGPLTLGALAAAEQVQPPTMTRIVSALEAAGLVRREPSPEDRRSIWIRATDVGKHLLAEGRTRRTESLARQLAALPPEELATLARAAEIVDRLALSLTHVGVLGEPTRTPFVVLPVCALAARHLTRFVPPAATDV